MKIPEGIFGLIGHGPVTEEEAEAAGRDAAVSGSNTTNSHFKFFGSPGLTAAWERGHEAGGRIPE